MPEINTLSETGAGDEALPVNVSAHRSSGLPYLPHVDGLRALAVLLVVLYHAWPWAVPGGFIGVDVFFVISGFIITRQLLVEMEEGTFSYVAFLGRRVRRLAPAALVCSVLVSAAAALLLMPDALEAFGKSLAAVWSMTANFYFYRTTGYFDAPAAEAPLLHTWSLAVEDQFYLTWPLLLLLLHRRLGARSRIAAAALGLAALSLMHSEISVARDPSFAFYMPLPRAFELLLGCALAIRWPVGQTPRWLGPIDALGLLLIIGSAFLIDAHTAFPGLAVVPTVVGSALCIAGGLAAATPVSRLLSLGPVVLIGKMSYSLYLYHWPYLALATYWLGRAPNAGEAAILVGLALVSAALSWLLVEQRLTRWLGLYEIAPWALLRRLIATATVLCLAGGALVLGKGFPQRLDAPAYNVYRAASTGNPMRAACDGYDLAFSHHKICTFGKPLAEGASYDIAVFGDSNADHFVPMIATLASEAGLSGRQVTQSTCAPLIGAARVRSIYKEEPCTLYQETILKFLDRNPGLRIAVLSSAWSGYPEIVTNRISKPEGPPERRTFDAFTRSTVEIFRKRGIKVLIIGQIPHFETFSLRCFADAARSGTETTACTIPHDTVAQALSTSQTTFAAIAKTDPGVTFLDMIDLLCPGPLCSAFKDGVLLYRDRGHLNAVGSAALARYARLPELDR